MAWAALKRNASRFVQAFNTETRIACRSWTIHWLGWCWPLLLFGVISGVYQAGTLLDMPLAVVDKDHSQLSRKLIRELDATSHAQVITVPAGVQEGARRDPSGRCLRLALHPAGLRGRRARRARAEGRAVLQRAAVFGRLRRHPGLLGAGRQPQRRIASAPGRRDAGGAAAPGEHQRVLRQPVQCQRQLHLLPAVRRHRAPVTAVRDRHHGPCAGPRGAGTARLLAAHPAGQGPRRTPGGQAGALHAAVHRAADAGNLPAGGVLRRAHQRQPAGDADDHAVLRDCRAERRAGAVRLHRQPLHRLFAGGHADRRRPDLLWSADPGIGDADPGAGDRRGRAADPHPARPVRPVPAPGAAQFGALHLRQAGAVPADRLHDRQDAPAQPPGPEPDMKNYLQILRETLKAMLSKPMWLMVVASVCITSLPYMNHTALDLPVAVVDEDHSDVSRELVRLLDSAPKVAVVGYDSLPQAKRDLAWRELYAIIVIPLNFEKRLLRGEALVIPYFGDATNRMANGQIQQDISAVYSALTNRYNAALLEREGFTATQAQVVLSPLVGQLTDLFNPGISFAAIVLPGLLSLILQHSLLLGCTRGNIMLRGGTPRYMRQPLSTRFGRYSAQLLIWTVLAMLFYVIWPHLLGYRQSASFFMLLGIVLPFLIAVIALSEFIAELLPTEESVYLTMTFITLPLFYMAGYSWPEQAMPDWVRWLADAIPSTWAIRAIAEMNQMDLPLREVSDHALVLLGMAATYALLGTLLYQYRNWRWDNVKGW
ncbi:LOW QUALITY PROTEIN: putative ABC-type multidrug transport system, permease component [Pseudomonas aeruginosa 39016]|nr:LOW QUALITY PROTEIN: putative ABC-type multidrug transport system, permease component [Pseudomonas aeruginosa 39016]